MITDTEIIMAYGKPEAKFKTGIQYQGLLSVFMKGKLYSIKFYSVKFTKVGSLSFP